MSAATAGLRCDRHALPRLVDGRPLLATDRHTMDVSFSGKPSDHIFEQEPGRPLEAFTGPFAEHVFGKSPEQLAMEEEEKSDETQVIPTPSHVLGRISPIFSPFFPVFARFHRLAETVPTSPKPEPRAKKQPAKGPRPSDLGPSFDTPDAG